LSAELTKTHSFRLLFGNFALRETSFLFFKRNFITQNQIKSKNLIYYKWRKTISFYSQLKIFYG